jgi:aspartyl-tRNA(Asn)/glutamyl-tRNA(Gln) amidotransferase subunit C
MLHEGLTRIARMSDAPASSDVTTSAPPKITRDEVARLAHLARIDLSDAELDHLAPQLAVILESVAAVSGVAADEIEPTSHAVPLRNVFRPDDNRASLTAEQALAGAPAVEQQRFSVPRILGEEA